MRARDFLQDAVRLAGVTEKVDLWRVAVFGVRDPAAAVNYAPKPGCSTQKRGAFSAST